MEKATIEDNTRWSYCRIPKNSYNNKKGFKVYKITQNGDYIVNGTYNSEKEAREVVKILNKGR